MSHRVIVVGSINIDLVVTAERLPRPGETVTGGTFARHHGGKGGNQAVAAARMGAPTVFIGAVGDDEFGTSAVSALEAEGVDTSQVRRLEGQATGVALILVGEVGENLISVASGANLDVGLGEVREAFDRLHPDASDVVLVGHEIRTAAAREALALGRAAGATTIFNPAPPGGLDRATFGLADVLTPNRQELAALVVAEGRRVGRSLVADEPAAMAQALLAPNSQGSGPGALLVSLGRAGALLVRPGSSVIDLPAPRVAAVDTTGAGDTLNGALAAGLAAVRSLEEAAERAVGAASLSTAIAGAREGMPTARELESGRQTA
jgi:ribokinase